MVEGPLTMNPCAPDVEFASTLRVAVFVWSNKLPCISLSSSGTVRVVLRLDEAAQFNVKEETV